MSTDGIAKTQHAVPCEFRWVWSIAFSKSTKDITLRTWTLKRTAIIIVSKFYVKIHLL